MKRRKLLLMLTVGLSLFAILCYANAQANLRVNVMPSGYYAWPGRTLTIWGNVHDGTPPYEYTWSFGDGTPSISGTVTDPRYIAVTHSYATMGPKIASLTVTDNLGAVASDQVRIGVVPKDDPLIRPQSNAAIQDGLRYLYLTQHTDGYWQNASGFRVASTALAVLAFENNGHRPGNDINEDIYVETVETGLQYIFNHGHTRTIGPQSAGNPDVDADGKGICF